MTNEEWKELALAPTCQEERDAVNKGPEDKGLFMRDDREIFFEITFLEQEIKRLQARKRKLRKEHKESQKYRMEA